MSPAPISTPGISRSAPNRQYATAGASSRSWAASTLLPSNETSLVSDGLALYDPNASTTFQALTHYTCDIGYIDGSGSLGIVGIEAVSIGGVTLSMPLGGAGPT
ncbi:MAG: hypothetical protein LQ340_004424 [Diploschistes diacapsis]|nr:MAG: hypothetical protein LQ340_004424 [Diploschistes diacapsis]